MDFVLLGASTVEMLRSCVVLLHLAMLLLKLRWRGNVKAGRLSNSPSLQLLKVCFYRSPFASHLSLFQERGLDIGGLHSRIATVTAAERIYFITTIPRQTSSTTSKLWGSLAFLLPLSDPRRWVYLGEAARSGRNSIWFLEGFADEVEKFASGFGSSAAVFAIGRALKGNVDEDRKIIFDTSWGFERMICVAVAAVEFFNFQLACYRKAVDAWTIVGIRLNVVKDVRKLIAQRIWESRPEAKYET